MEVNKIYHGDSLQILKTFPNDFVDCCITSPPYWNLRDYKTEGQLGSEHDFNDYISKLVLIFSEVKRVIKPTGSIWLNLGDTYNGNKKGKTDNKYSVQVKDANIAKHTQPYLPEKSMCLIPERIAIALTDHVGLTLRDKVIWWKPNAMPESVQDRFGRDWEYIFRFVKAKKYYWEQQYRPISTETAKEIQKVYNGIGRKDYGGNNVQNPSDVKRRILKGLTVIDYKVYKTRDFTKSGSKQDVHKSLHTGDWSNVKQARMRGPAPGSQGYKYAVKLGWNPGTSYADWYFNIRQKKSWHDHTNDKEMGFGHQKKRTQTFTPQLEHPYGSKMRTVWRIPTKSFKGAHFATFNTALLETPIRASCPPNGLILDCFMGAGTTALAALQLGRQFVGIELNESYIQMAYDRLKPYLYQTKLTSAV